MSSSSTVYSYSDDRNTYTDPLLIHSENQSYKHRKSQQRFVTCLASLVIFLIGASYLLWPSEPELSIVRLKIVNMNFNTHNKISIDLTLDLTVNVRNRDFYSLDYEALTVGIGYRGNMLGTVMSKGGHIVPRGREFVDARVELIGVEVADFVLLMKDLANGAVMFDAVSEMKGTLGLYLFHLPIKTKISCEVIVNTRTDKMSRQNCYSEVSEVR